MELKTQLEAMVGQEASVNNSPTLRAKLIKVLDNGKCMWEITPSHYNDKGNEFVGNTFHLPMWISGNCFWGV